MNNSYLNPFTKSILTSLFAGIVATLLCLFYNIFYRNSSGFMLSDFINVSSLIFAVNLLFLLIGVVYYGFLKLSRFGNIIFMIAFLVLTVVLAIGADHIQRSVDPQLNTEFHQLFIPMVVVMGLLAAFGVPFLYQNKKFEEAVL